MFEFGQWRISKSSKSIEDSLFKSKKGKMISLGCGAVRSRPIVCRVVVGSVCKVGRVPCRYICHFQHRVAELGPKLRHANSSHELVIRLSQGQIAGNAQPVPLVIGGMLTRKVPLFPQDHSVHQPESDYRQHQ
mgnify:CR=1 FL=1